MQPQFPGFGGCAVNLFRTALFGACLAVPAALAGGAMAQPADGTRVIQVPPGAVVLILGAPSGVASGAPQVITAASPDEFPMMRLIAEQRAMVQHMMADMSALFGPMPSPSQLIQAAMGASGSQGMHGVCGESVTYSYSGNGSQPVVHVSHYGDACGASAGGAQNVTESQETEPAIPHGPKVLDIGYPARAVPPGQPPRT
jgi:hypothetical protein